MIIRRPTEPTKPSQFGLVTCLLGGILVLTGAVTLAVGIWARRNDEAFAGTTLVVGGFTLGLGLLTLISLVRCPPTCHLNLSPVQREQASM